MIYVTRMLKSLSCLSFLVTQQALAVGAVYWGPSGEIGYSWDYENYKEARKVAQYRCGEDCSLLEDYANECIAFAKLGHSGYLLGRHPSSKQGAEQDLYNRCRHNGNSCSLNFSICDGQ